MAVTAANTGANLFSSTGPFPVPDRIDVVSGSPGEPRLGSYGEVGFQPVNVLHGTPDGAPLPPLDNTRIAGLDPAGRFGASVIAADIVTHFDDRSARSEYGLLAAGQELLVGEPGTDRGGRVHWLYSAYDADPDVDSLSSPDLYAWQHGGVYDPGLGSGAGFGATIVTPEDPGWGTQVSYAVVAAPEIDAVFVLPLTATWTPGSGTPATATPFTSSIRIDGTAVGLPARSYTSKFGDALLLEDLDGDGVDDLIIGAPGDYCPPASCTPSTPSTPTKGEVFVIPGAAPGVFDTAKAFQIQPPPAGWFNPGSGFGAALAAGFLHDAPDSGGVPTLVIGAPRAQSADGFISTGADPGQVCQIHFPSGFPAPTGPSPTPQKCDPAPWEFSVDAGPTGADRMHLFGAQLAVANLVEQDSVGSNTTVAGAMHELLVGSPRSQQAIPGVYTTGGAGSSMSFDYGGTPVRGSAPPVGATGVVAMFKSAEGQGAVVRLDDEDVATLALQTLRSGTTPVNGEHLGSAVAVHQLSVVGPLPDLVLGEPRGIGTGQVSFTRSSDSVAGFTSGLGGEWSTTDSDGVERPVALLPSAGNYGVLFQGFAFEVREDGGDPASPLCTKAGFSGATSLSAYFDDVMVAEDTDPTDGVPATTPTQTIELKDGTGAPVLRFSADIVHQDLGGTHTMSLSLFNAEQPASEGGWQALWPGDDCRPVTGAGGGTFILTLEVPNACE